METTPSRALEVVPVRQGAPEEDVRGQAEGGDGLRKASETVALVCAGALAGGGAGMLAGVALGAINPYALGLFGVSAGTVATVLPKVAGGAQGTARKLWRRRWFGG
jgi:hypothetical protein